MEKSTLKKRPWTRFLKNWTRPGDAFSVLLERVVLLTEHVAFFQERVHGRSFFYGALKVLKYSETHLSKSTHYSISNQSRIFIVDTTFDALSNGKLENCK